MNLYNNQLFHIYNQGNNRQQIFFDDDDYKRFLWKMKSCVLPFGDLIAYCLMPNHFHWLINIRSISISKEKYYKHYSIIENQRRRSAFGTKYIKYKIKVSLEGEVSLNDVIGILLSSYTKYINKRYEMSGSLFRQHCKAKDGWVDGLNTINERVLGEFSFGNVYAYTCFNYIHENPVVAGLVEKAIDYKYSSALDYAGLRNGTLCDIVLGKELVQFI